MSRTLCTGINLRLIISVIGRLFTLTAPERIGERIREHIRYSTVKC